MYCHPGALISTPSCISHTAQWLFSAVLFGLTATRLHYTLHLPPNDPLNHGHSFYDPIAAELLAASILAMFWSSFMYVIRAACPRASRALCSTVLTMQCNPASTSFIGATTMAGSQHSPPSSSASSGFSLSTLSAPLSPPYAPLV